MSGRNYEKVRYRKVQYQIDGAYRTKATTLDLSGNQLTALPPEIMHLTALQRLDLRGNHLTALSPEIRRLTALEHLDLSGNQLTALPPEIMRLTALEHFDLSGNQLTALPPEIMRLTALEHFDLSGNQLTALPPEIMRLTALQVLILDGNQLTALPSEITRLTALERLYLNGNRLTALPPEITRLTMLRHLALSNNRLIVLPLELTRLTTLERLDLRENQLIALPPEIARLTALKHLDLRENQLTALPRTMGQLLSLERAAAADIEPFTEGLFLNGNPLPQPYPSFIAEDQPSTTRNVLAWLRAEPDPKPPLLPAQGTGPHFAVDAEGVIGFAPPGDLDRQGNNIARLRALHPVLRDMARDLVAALSAGNAPHGYLRARAEAYGALLDPGLEAMNFSRLYAEGVRLATAGHATAAEIAKDELPSLSLEAQEIFDSLLRLHGPFVMATIEGIEAITAEERYARRPDEEREYRAAGVDFVESLQHRPGLIRPEAAATLLGVAKETGLGSHPERSAVIGMGAVRNVAITLTASAMTALLPGLGQAALWVGGGALAAGGWLALLAANEAVKGSKAFKAVVAEATHQIDKTVPPPEPDAATTRFLAGVAGQLTFLLSIQPKLRRLAKSDDQSSWINQALDWIKAQTDKNKKL